jgi:small subunit ribosomal protein S6
MFIVKPDATDELVDPLIESLSAVITADGGTIEQTQKMGVRKLAYEVGRFSEGYYVLLRFTAPGSVIKEIERRLRVNDLVIKNLTVRLDEDMKWADKRKKKREARLARKPQPVAAPAQPAAAPGAPAPAMPSEPAAPAPGKPNDNAPAVEAPAPAAAE